MTNLMGFCVDILMRHAGSVSRSVLRYGASCPPARYMHANLGPMLATDHTRTLINPDLARTGQRRERLEDFQRLRVVKRMRCAHIHPLPLHTFT